MRKSRDDYKYEILEFIGELSAPKLHSEWCKSVIKTLMNEEEVGVDIRWINKKSNMLEKSKGIRLTDEETNNLVDILLRRGYGSDEAIKEALAKREEIFKEQ